MSKAPTDAKRRRSERLQATDPYPGIQKSANGIFKTQKVSLNDAVKSKAGLSKLAAAQNFTGKLIEGFKPFRLDDGTAKPFLELFEQGDKKRSQGKSFIVAKQDTNDRPLSLFGIAEDVQHDRGITPSVPKLSSNEDNSHGFPQSLVSNPFETDQVRRMTAENYIGNQGTTRKIETFMSSQPSSQLKKGNIAKFRETEFSPTDSTTFSPIMVRDTILKRSNSANHIDVMFSLEHDNANIDRS